MKNRVVYRNKGGCEWAEIVLVGRRPLLAKVDLSDLKVLGKYRWGWHPRGVFDHVAGVLLTHVLMPDARQVFFQNHSRLDCRRDNLLTGTVTLRRRVAAIAGRGVFYDPSRGAYIAHHKRLGVAVYGYFRVKDYPCAADAEGAALRKRAEFLAMTDSALLAEKARRGGPATDHERWLGEDIAGAIAERVNHDATAAAQKGYEAGLLAARVVSSSEISRWQEFGGKRNGRAMASV